MSYLPRRPFMTARRRCRPRVSTAITRYRPSLDVTRSWRARSSSAHDAVLLHAEPGDAHLDDVSRLNVARRLHAVRDAGRGARGDDVAGAQRHEATDVGYELPRARRVDDRQRRGSPARKYPAHGLPRAADRPPPPR